MTKILIKYHTWETKSCTHKLMSDLSDASFGAEFTHENCILFLSDFGNYYCNNGLLLVCCMFTAIFCIKNINRLSDGWHFTENHYIIIYLMHQS